MRVEREKTHVNLQFCTNLGDLYLYRIAFQSYSSHLWFLCMVPASQLFLSSVRSTVIVKLYIQLPFNCHEVLFHFMTMCVGPKLRNWFVMVFVASFFFVYCQLQLFFCCCSLSPNYVIYLELNVVYQDIHVNRKYLRHFSIGNSNCDICIECHSSHVSFLQMFSPSSTYHSNLIGMSIMRIFVGK